MIVILVKVLEQWFVNQEIYSNPQGQYDGCSDLFMVSDRDLAHLDR